MHGVVPRSTFPSQNVKHTTCSDHFWAFRCRSAWEAQGCAHCQKWAKCEGHFSSFNGVARRGTCEEDLQRCIFRGRGNTRDMFIRDVRRSGRWFPQIGCILEHQIFSFGKMILCDRCSTSYDLASLLLGRRNALDTWETSQNGKMHWHEAVSSALNFPHYWRKSRRIASFWYCQLQKLRKSPRIALFLTLMLAA